MNAILIPAYKPDNELIELSKQLISHEDVRLIVVNDGSGQAYDPVFQALPEAVTLLTHEVNKGKGCALKLGIRHVYENMPDCERIITADADGQHRYEDIQKVIARSAAHPGALILGSRAFDENVPLRSKFGNALTRQLFAITSGVKVRDTQTGLRAFDRPCMQKFMTIPGDRYEYEINMLLSAARFGIPILEETIKTVYINDNSASHFHPIRDSFKIYLCLIKFACSSLASFLIDFLLFTLFSSFWPLALSNVLARVISATANFVLNKKVVFKGDEKLLPAIVKYAMLAVFILAVNTLVLTVLVEHLGWNKTVSKILTECILFFVNFFVQGKLVYRKRK